jgi:mono/diheme cytochrome c family protein
MDYRGWPRVKETMMIERMIAGHFRHAARLVAFAAAIAAAAPVQAAGVAEAARGIVVEHCAACHLVPDFNPGARAPMAGAPAFQDIADDPATYAPERITRFLRQPHFPMKRIVLSPSDIENLLAYFESLRGRPR